MSARGWRCRNGRSTRMRRSPPMSGATRRSEVKTGDLAWRIEETCFNAFPSLKQVLLGEWLLRFAEGLSRRANSANPLGPECRDVARVIAAAEALYEAHDLPTIFRVPSILDAVLDQELAA